MIELWIFLSVLVVSLIGALAIIPVMFHANNHRVLVFLLSFAAGSLIAAVLIHFIPEMVVAGYTLGSTLLIIAGFLVFFVLEKFIHAHHKTAEKHSVDDVHAEGVEGHAHAFHLAPMNLIGDAVHNFLDGIVIAVSYLVSIPLGIAATIAVIAHEVPQEIADFGILFYAGLSKMRALVFNVLAALTAFLGALVGYIGGSALAAYAVPLAAGGFLYIGSATLMPQLHRHCGLRESIEHIVAFLLGAGIIVLVTLYAPHAH